MSFLQQRVFFGAYKHDNPKSTTIVSRNKDGYTATKISGHYTKTPKKELSPEEKARREKIAKAKNEVDRMYRKEKARLYGAVQEPLMEKVRAMNLPIKIDYHKNENIGFHDINVSVDVERILGKDLYEKVKGYTYGYYCSYRYNTVYDPFTGLLNHIGNEILKYGVTKNSLERLKETYAFDLQRLEALTKESKKIFVSPKARRANKEAIKTCEEIVLAQKLACKTLVEKVSEAVELLSEEDKEVLRDFLCERSYNSKVDKLNAKRNKLYERIEKRYSKEQEMTK